MELGEGDGRKGLRPTKEGAETNKIVSQTVKRGKLQNSNHLHNIQYVAQSTF